MPTWKCTIPIRGYLKQYLAFYMPIDPIDLNLKNVFNLYIFSVLDKPAWFTKSEYDKFDNEITIVIDKCFTRFNKNSVNEFTVEALDSFINKHFYDNLYIHLDLCVSFGMKYKESLMFFIKKYNLEEYIDYDTLKKNYYRYRKKNGNPHLQTSILISK